jgi:hypothetical protein
MSEDKRYQAVQSQVTDLLDAAANDQSTAGLLGLGQVWLAAEIYTRNEQAHERHIKKKRKRHA